jgi:23S rRNA (guanosine2251-2'-O)-methyltransferase
MKKDTKAMIDPTIADIWVNAPSIILTPITTSTIPKMSTNCLEGFIFIDSIKSMSAYLSFVNFEYPKDMKIPPTVNLMMVGAKKLRKSRFGKILSIQLSYHNIKCYKVFMKIIVVLPDIRSTYNVGSIFRTADAVNVDRVLLTGYTPAPVDKFGRPRKDISKTALGAEVDVPWEHLGGVDDDGSDPESKKTNQKVLEKLIKKLKKENSFVVAVEQGPTSVDYLKLSGLLKEAVIVKDIKQMVLVFGNEVEGLSKEIIKKCDVSIELPMAGKKESLNVSVAAGIVLYKVREVIG